jgi:uncharacterized protein (TIGR03435 family)
LFVGIRSLLGIRAVLALRRNSEIVTDSHRSGLFAQLRQDACIDEPIELRIGGAAIPPMTWGVFKQTVLLPAVAADWTDDRLCLVLAHELAHVKRRDGLFQILIQAACSVYWFNPLIWYASHRVRIERERAADDAVLNLGADADDYAAHLLQIARGVVSGWTFATLYMAHPSQLESRLRSIIDSRTERRTLSRWAAVSLVGSTILLTILTGAIHLTAKPQPEVPTARIETPETPAQAVSDRFNTWLDEEVVYIISEQEKTAFSQLTSDEERDLFIEQFWQRRDPTPGTPENEFKQEHYDRLAYTNTRFSTLTGVPGWKTDRGCIYILYGKPDEIDDHPSGSQEWTYNYLEPLHRRRVQLQFIDSTHTGEYRLMIDAKEGEILRKPPVVRQQAVANAQRPFQNARRLSFEVASVKPVSDTILSTRPIRKGGRFEWRTDLWYMLGYAYQLQPDRLSGPIPGSGSIYAVEATFDPAASDDDVRLMLQTLLKDRFKMVTHTVTKEVDGYRLSVAASGLRLKEVQPDEKPAPFPDWLRDTSPTAIERAEGSVWTIGITRDVGAITGRRVSLAQLSGELERLLQVPVSDQTGVKGNFYFAFQYASPSASGDVAVPALSTALQENLGLRLTPQRGKIDMLVVDHIEKVPVAN